MHLQLFTDHPSWFWLLCILAGLIYAGGMYYRERKIQSAISKRRIHFALSALRFLAIFFIAVLLLDPYIRSRSNTSEKPIVILAGDNSSSISEGGMDSTAMRNMLSELQKALGSDFDIRGYTFGTALHEGIEQIHLQEHSTDIASAVNALNNLYENLPVAALVMATDGIYTTGSNPVYAQYDIAAPVFTIALGDTVPKKDLRILRALHNSIVYLNDQFTIDVDLEALFCTNADMHVNVSEIRNGKATLTTDQHVRISSENFQTSLTFTRSADVPGILHFRISATPISGEATLANNTQDIYVEVLDARQKILLLANAPHPDLHAIRESIVSNRNYDVDMQYANTFNGNISGYDLIILHQLPSVEYSIVKILGDIRAADKPIFFITGSETSIPAFNNAQGLLRITGNAKTGDEVTALYNNAFNVFTQDPKAISNYPQWPALIAPYGQYNVSPTAQVLMTQKIGSVATKNPLFIFSIPGGEKTAILCGENIWKWRMYDYVLTGSQDIFDGLISKSIQYLATKNNKKQFDAFTAKNVFNENESIRVDAELYNDSYERINTPDATITLQNESGDDFPFSFSKTGDAYTLDAGFFPPGNYTYTAKTTYNGKEYADKGAFSISPVQWESINTTADHGLLYQMAHNTGGEMVYAGQMQELAEKIKSLPQAKPVLHETIRTQSIINIPWLFFLILAFLGAEWFVRKYNGSY